MAFVAAMIAATPSVAGDDPFERLSGRAASSNRAADFVPPIPRRAPILPGTIGVACPENALGILIIGQSNAANHGEAAGFIERPAIPALMHLDGACHVARQPLAGATHNPDFPPRWGGVGPRLAQMLAWDLRQPVVVLGAGAGSYSARNWASDAHGQLSWTRRQAALAARAGIDIRFVIISQGETDAWLGTSAEAWMWHWRRVMDTLVHDARMRGRVPPRFLITVGSSCLQWRSPAVRAAQVALAAERDDTDALVDTDRLGANHRIDGCHFNRAGLESAAWSMAQAVKMVLARR